MISPVLRPKLWAALLGVVAAAAMATPAWADPLPDTVPDTGLRPPQVSVQIPGLPGQPAGGLATTAPVTNPAGGPLMAQVNAAETQVAQLGENLVRVKGERDDAQAQLTLATTTLQQARDALARAQEKARNAAADAVKADAALPPGAFGSDLRQLDALQRITRGDKAQGATTAVDGEVARATSAAQIAQRAYDSAQQRATEKAAEYVKVEGDLHRQEAALLKLRKDNSALLLAAARQEDAAEQQLGGGYVVNQNVSGLAAHPTALAAVRYALAQLGDPYLWAAEGPDRFDCSGLMLASYQAAGYQGLPRVSRDQYYATRTRTVDPNALLPGDLLFFASGSSWTSIHHVAMYIGNGKMVEAPRTGDVVKISVVRWSRLYAATRVVGGVPGPATSPPAVPATPAPAPGATKTPKPKPTPSATKPTHSPSPRPSTSSPSPSTSPSSSPTPTPSTSPSPTPSDPPAPSPTGATSEPSTTTTRSAAPTSSESSTTTRSAAPTGSTVESASAAASSGS
ncbi:Cell wall-associated hydrolase, NlpC family [Micromonospora auratinigra]|uniref:Cell wall-associated hydrolase, NlpC family n=1 Tax=Micromonospora auratinigra TaxID=261654 RepID=A0A1A9A3D8_9ACTN|nr:Cell wall-associated hydrolase, NlpC family [Micromonospora auratinigra]